MDGLKHGVHFQFHAVLEVPHVDAYEVNGCLHNGLVYSFLTEFFTLLNAVYYEGRKFPTRKFKQLLKAINVEIKR